MTSELGKLLLLQTLGLNALLALGFLCAATRLNVAWTTVVLIFLAFFGARNAGHAFNQLVDVRYDRANPRTQDRPLVTGGMRPSTAAAVVVANVALVIGCSYLLNRLVLLLAPVALAIVLGYSYSKRYTAWTTVLLGLVQSIIPAGVYLATQQALPAAALVGATAVLLFGTAFETVHSLGDLDTDRKLALHSLPLALGRSRALDLMAGLFGGSLAFFALYGLLARLSPWFFFGWFGMAAFLVLEIRFVRRTYSSDEEVHPQGIEGGSPLVANLVVGGCFLVGVLLGLPVQG